MSPMCSVFFAAAGLCHLENAEQKKEAKRPNVRKSRIYENTHTHTYIYCASATLEKIKHTKVSY